MPQIKSPHLSHQVGWLRLADINTCPWFDPFELSMSTISSCSLMSKSEEPRRRQAVFLRDRISDDKFKEVCGNTCFPWPLVVSQVNGSLLLSTFITRPGNTEYVQFNLPGDHDSGLTESDDKFCCDIAALTQAHNSRQQHIWSKQSHSIHCRNGSVYKKVIRICKYIGSVHTLHAE